MKIPTTCNDPYCVPDDPHDCCGCPCNGKEDDDEQ